MRASVVSISRVRIGVKAVYSEFPRILARPRHRWCILPDWSVFEIRRHAKHMLRRRFQAERVLL